jgi:hypothetical protein
MLTTTTKVIDYLMAPVLKPIQIDRKIVKVRKVLNKIMRHPVRIQNVNLSTLTVETIHLLPNKQSVTHVSKLKGRIATRIETYANKQVVLVFTNVNDAYLKPYKKTVHS